MGKPKKLKLQKTVATPVPISKRAFVDRIDELYAKEHYGYYLVVKLGTSSTRANNRIYLEREKYIEYQEEAKEKDEFWRKPEKDARQHLYSNFPQYESFIFSYLSTVINDIEAYSIIKSIITGVDLVLKCAKKKETPLQNVSCLSAKTQQEIHDTFMASSPSKNDKRMFRMFFTRLERYSTDFTMLDLSGIPLEEYIPRESLPTTTIYKIDYYARNELKTIFAEAKEYGEWMKELEKIELFSLENLAKTFYDGYKRESRPSTHTRLMRRIALTLHNTDLLLWRRKEREKIFFRNKEDEAKYKSLLKLGETEGINIAIDNEKNFALWHKTLFPNYPFSADVDPRYKEVFSSIRDFRLRYYRLTKKEITEFDRRVFPTLQTAFLLAIILLIREGINTEVLKTWKIKTLDDGSLSVGDRIASIATVITGIKGRSNKLISTPIGSNSEELRMIDAYLDMLSPHYEKSDSDLLFQYFTPQKGKNFEWRTSKWTKDGFFANAQTAKASLFKKYAIQDTSGERIYKIQPSRIRPSVNYVNYLRGYSLYERQIELGHSNAQTQLDHYENSSEWHDSKNHKIAKTQELVLGIFGGTIERDNPQADKYFAGLFADCENPYEPDYPGATPLKKNEACGDWFMCLNSCSKAKVIPEWHGETICASIEFMKNELKEFIRIEDWNKEYLPRVQAAESALESFTPEEKEEAERNAHKHIETMRLRLKTRLKPEGLKHGA